MSDDQPKGKPWPYMFDREATDREFERVVMERQAELEASRKKLPAVWAQIDRGPQAQGVSFKAGDTILIPIGERITFNVGEPLRGEPLPIERFNSQHKYTDGMYVYKRPSPSSPSADSYLKGAAYTEYQPSQQMIAMAPGPQFSSAVVSVKPCGHEEARAWIQRFADEEPCDADRNCTHTVCRHSREARALLANWSEPAQLPPYLDPNKPLGG